jgi:diguanylate cyclase (GGDEF)-like protein
VTGDGQGPRRLALGDRIGGVLNWGSVDKCVLAAALTLPFVGSYLVLGHYLRRRPQLVDFLDYGVLEALLRVLVWVAVAWAVLLLAGLRLRRQVRESPSLVHATIQLYAISNAVLIYCVGPFTSPLWLILLGAGMIGFLVFERRAVLLGLASLLLIEAAATLAERVGLIPYAPLLARPPYSAPGRPAGSWMAYMGGVTFGATIIIWALFAYIITRWREQEARFRELSMIDGLTRITNRRHFMELFQQEFERAERYRSRLACVLVDLDHFKDVNDSFGHLVGDQVLLAVAGILRDSSRKLDVVARYGGEEFALLLPETDPEGARIVAERYRRALEQARVFAGGASLGVTASIGVACYPDDAVRTIDDLLRRADAALYRAKAAGRNRVVFANGAAVA